jgi:plastocyanin
MRFKTIVTSSFVLLLLISASALAITPKVRVVSASSPRLGYPNSMAATGDSITRAFNLSAATALQDAPQYSWSTGTDNSINSQYSRILAANAASSGNNFNDAVSGAKMANLDAQITTVNSQNVEYVTILMGANDVCTNSEASMTLTDTFRTQFQTALHDLATGSPDVRIFVASIPNIYNLWSIFNAGDAASTTAQNTWTNYSICQSMLANPSSTAQADIDRRARVQQRNLDFNTVLAQICALYIHCRFDNNAVYSTAFTQTDVSTVDYYHPAAAGQAKLATFSYLASFDFSDNVAPVSTATVTSIANGYQVSFNATDNVGVAGIEYRFGTGAWSTYTSSFIVTDTAQSLFYRAVDVNGNNEVSKMVTFPNTTPTTTTPTATTPSVTTTTPPTTTTTPPQQTCTPPAYIVKASPSSLTFIGSSTTTPASQVISLTAPYDCNGHPYTPQFTSTVSYGPGPSNWITLIPNTGGLNGSAPFAVSVNTALFANTSGVYTATLAFAAPGYYYQPASVDVTYNYTYVPNSVSIVDFGFQPQNITITAGSSLTWTNNGTHNHTSTSDIGLWDSGTLAPGQSYTHLFNTPGVYTYHCSFHSSMTATVTVVPSSVSSYTYNLPFLANNYIPTGQTESYTTFLAVQNLGANPATLSIQYFDPAGNVVNGPPLSDSCNPIPAHGECLAPNPMASGKQGTGIISSSQPINAIVAEATPFGGSAYAVSAGSAANLIAPFIYNKAFGSYSTQLHIFNAGSSMVTATVNFYDYTGSLAITATKTFAIGPKQSYSLDQAASDSGLYSNFQGWAQLTSAAGSQLSEQILEQDSDLGYVAILNATPSAATTVYVPTVFNVSYGTFYTGAAIVNPNNITITVTPSYYTITGTLYSTNPFQLGPYAVASIYDSLINPSYGLPAGGLPSGFTGAAIVTSQDGGIVMAINEYGGRTNAGTIESGTYVATSSGGSMVGLPVMANNGFGYTTGATVFNTSNTSVSATITYYNTDGSLAGSPQQFSIGPNASQPLYQGNVGLPNPFYGSAVVTQSSPNASLIVTTNALSNAFFYTYTEPNS